MAREIDGIPETAMVRSRVSDRIFDDLRRSIISGELPKGSKLPTERELALRYQVSGPTVRESIRGLTLLGLVDVRHGSGAYVTAETDSLVALSIGAVIQLGQLGVGDVLGVFGMLSEQAARLAACLASPEDIAILRAMVAALENIESVGAATVSIRAFHTRLAVASGNKLLVALCGFLADVQLRLGLELAGQSLPVWRKIAGDLNLYRRQLVDAIAEGDPDRAASEARTFCGRAIEMITSLPKARKAQAKDPALSSLLSIITEVASG